MVIITVQPRRLLPGVLGTPKAPVGHSRSQAHPVPIPKRRQHPQGTTTQALSCCGRWLGAPQGLPSVLVLGGLRAVVPAIARPSRSQV